MPRPSVKERRRRELAAAFELSLAEHGYEGATVARIARRAGLGAGLVHHYFRDKDEMTEALLAHLVDKLRRRFDGANGLSDVIDRALQLSPRSDVTAAKAWVGVFAESVRKPALRRRLRTVLRGLHQRFGRDGASDDDALGLLALIVGFLVLGAIDPQLTAGRAAGIAKTMLRR